MVPVRAMALTTPTLEPLGTLEQSVMDVVWQHAPATARDVCERLHGARERAYTTIMTTMDRLHRKGLLRRAKDGLAWRYEPVLSKVEFEQTLADRLAASLLAAHGGRALAAFVDATAEADEALLEQLAALIEARRKGAP